MKSRLLIFLILLLDLVAFTIILPLFPSIVDFYERLNDKNATNKDVSLNSIIDLMNWLRVYLKIPDYRRYNIVLIGGILGSLFSFLQFLSSPMIGAFADVFGRKKVLVISMIGTLISYVVWLKADTFSIFLLSRIIGGLCKGSVTLCTTMMTDITTKETRGKGMAFIGLSFSLGFISGPLIGAYFATKAKSTGGLYSFTEPAQSSIVFQLASLALTLFMLEDTMTHAKKSLTDCLKNIFHLINPLNLFTFRYAKQNTNVSVLKRLTLTNFLFLLFFSGLEFTLTFLTHERFNFTSMQQGKLFFFAGVIMMVVQGGYVRRMKQNNEKSVAMQGIVVIIPAMILISIASTVQVTYVALLLYSFGAGTVVPCLTSLFTQHCEDKETGENIGIFRSAGAFARAIAPALTCSVYWSYGSSTCYMLGALLFVIPLCVLAGTRVLVTSEKSR